MTKLRKHKPITSSTRNLIYLNTKTVNKPLLKKKIRGFKNSTGTGHQGKILSHHRGGGHKQKYRSLDFKRTKNTIAIVLSIEYDPIRSGNIASIYNFSDKTYSYILAPEHLLPGNIIKSGNLAEHKNGHSLPLSKIPLGSFIHSISVKKSKKAQISRAAGSYSIILEKNFKYARILQSSGEQRYVPLNAFATIGVVSNKDKKLTNKSKAGRSRWLNNRPKVRGVAMNPIDHPHGGGEGKTSGGRTSVTPWGKPTKNKKTSKSTNYLRLIN